MTYVISDLHGYSIEKLKILLKKQGLAMMIFFTYSAM